MGILDDISNHRIIYHLLCGSGEVWIKIWYNSTYLLSQKYFTFHFFNFYYLLLLTFFLIFFNQWMGLKVSFYKYQSQPFINIVLDLNSNVKRVWDSFSYFIHFKIGDCRKLHFWHGHWFGEFILKERSQIFLLDRYSNGYWMFNLLIILWGGKIWNVTIFSSLKHLELKPIKTLVF